jgi:hypothetical protein
MKSMEREEYLKIHDNLTPAEKFLLYAVDLMMEGKQFFSVLAVEALEEFAITLSDLQKGLNNLSKIGVVASVGDGQNKEVKVTEKGYAYYQAESDEMLASAPSATAVKQK